MKYIVLVIFLVTLTNSLPAQVLMRSYNEDSLRAKLKSNLPDTKRIDVLLNLASSYYFKQADTCLLYATEALVSSRRLKYDSGILVSLIRGGEAMRQLGNFTGALKNQLEALEVSQKIENEFWEAISTGYVGLNYVELKDYDHAFVHLKKAIAMRKNVSTDGLGALFRLFMARAYNETNQMDSAFYFLNEARVIYRNPQFPQLRVFLTYSFGDVFVLANKIDSAEFYYRRALKYAFENLEVVPNHVSTASYKLATVFNERNQIDSSFYFARYAFMVARTKNLNPRILDASRLLAKLHRKTGKLDSALFYQDIANATNERMYGRDKFIELQLLLSQEQRRTEEIQRAEEKRVFEVQQAQERFRNNTLIIGLVTVTTIILVATILLFRSNRVKQKTNLVLQQTLNELKATQSQLIQAEKMASLGELTAGIAHEIQNPLNFVNNFSEVNEELLSELKGELSKGKMDDAIALANDAIENQKKINHHSKRADAIVKGMLQHSRTSSGTKEPTDINALCDEYLRLSYHGLRAKDKSFNAKFETHFDSTLGKINVVPQDIGRVILNLINNAFYAVAEKQKQNLNSFEPTVSVSTKVLNARGKVEIKVADNGNGIPDRIKEKIFQPFFTTKPTGQGTGLGLSLSYDIVKAHGGTLEMNSPPAGRAGKEGVGSEFIIQLPT